MIRRFMGCAVLALSLALPARSQAQEPIVVLAINNVNSLKEDVGYLLGLAGKAELLAMADPVLAQSGIDATKPWGALVSMGLGPQVIAYIPVANPTQFVNFLKQVPGIQEPQPGMYQMQAGAMPVVGKVVGGYFVATNNQLLFGGQIPDFAAQAGKLVAEHDIAFHLNIAGIPPQLAAMPLGMMEMQLQNLPRLPNESDTDYANRKAMAGMSVKQVRDFLNEGQSYDIGLAISKADRVVFGDATVVAKPGTKLAESYSKMAGKPTRLNRLMTDDAPLNISFNGELPPESIQVLNQLVVDRLEKEVPRLVAESKPDERPHVEKLLKTVVDVLRTNINGGRLQFVMSTAGAASGPFTFFGAGMLQRAGEIEDQVAALVKASSPPELKMDVAEHKGLRIHRIEIKLPDAEAQKVFGANPALHFSVAQDAVFFALGNDSLPTLQRSIDVAADRSGSPVSRPPMYFQVRSGLWLNLIPEFDDPKLAVFRQELQSDDRLTGTMAPIENGMRARIEFQEGYLRAVAKAAAQQAAGGR